MSAGCDERLSPCTLIGRRLSQDRKSRGEQRLSDWINSESAEILEGLVERYRMNVDAKASRGKVLDVIIKGEKIP